VTTDDRAAFPELTPTEKRGELRCGSQPSSGAPTCGEPATWHVAWRLTPGDAHFSLVCDLHMAMARHDLVYVDRHSADVVCDMPGTGWAADRPSRCAIATTENMVKGPTS
jgi:hypothetical protein